MSEGESELQSENAKLQDKINELQKELSQSRDAEADLTQALAKVTIEKTRMERELQKLRDQAKDTANNQLAEALSANKTLKAKIDEANSKIQSLEAELKTSSEAVSQLRLENKALAKEAEKVAEELDKERANMSRSSEELTNLRSELERERRAREKAEETLAQTERETATTAGVAHAEKADNLESNAVEETDSPLPPPVGPKPVEDVENVADEVSPDKTTKPVEIPVEDVEETAGSGKEEPNTEEDVAEEQEDEKEGDVVVKAEGVTLTVIDDAKDSASEIDDEEFDKVGSLKCLDNTSAIDKAHLFAKQGRKRPSRKHIQTMAHQSPFPDEMLPLKVLEGDGSGGPLSPPGNPPHKLPKPDLKVAPKPKLSELAKPQPQAVAPKPKPRPQPRKKPSPEHSSDAGGAQTPEISKKPIPMPRSPSQEALLENSDRPSLVGEKLSSPTQALSQSPVHAGKMPPAVPSKSPKASPVHSRKDVADELPTSASPAPPKKPKPHLPKPSPRSHKVDDSKSGEEKKRPVSGDPKLEELQNKDPSELTVKEKMMLAQAAMAKQAEQKSKGLPPAVRKKPPVKAPSVDHIIDEHNQQAVQRGSFHEQDIESSMERSRSMDNVLEDGQSTPDQRRKLPPGAFNISIPMGLPGEMRHRSATHAGITSPDNTMKRGSTEVEHALNDQQDSAQVSSQDRQGTPSRKSDVPDAVSSEGTPQHSGSNIHTSEGSRRDTVANSMGPDEFEDDLDDEAEAEVDPDSLMQQVSSSDSTRPDPEQVLYWSPEVVGIWLRKIGLGKHSASFTEKNIKGHVLFELDGAKLKGLGINSNDDKSVFKKEIKALRPFAEKIRKEYEKAKKDEKKRAEQEKKLAKKKKK